MERERIVSRRARAKTCEICANPPIRSLILFEVRRENEIVIRKAKVVLLTDEPEAIVLSKTDWNRFVELLEQPPAPNAELRALLAEDGPKGDN